MPAVRRHNAANLNLATRLGTPLTTDWYANEFRRLGAVAHFDPGLGATDDGTTSTWVDQIGGATVTSVSAGTRLTYSATGLNSRPCWVGDGISRYLRGASIAAVSANTHTIYSVAKSTAIGAVQMLCGAGSTSAQECFGFGLAATGAYNARKRATAAVDSFGGSILETANAPFVMVSVNSAGTCSSFSNGGADQAALLYTAAPAALDLFTVGAIVGYDTANVASRWFTGQIGDIVVFPTAHTAAQRMVVERLLAEKYGWSVLRGVTGFSTSNYLSNAGLTSGIRGDNAAGVWSDVLVRPDAVPSGTQYLASAFSANTGMGLYSAGAVATIQAYNGTTGASGPNRTVAAADVGKLALLGGGAGPANLCRSFWNGAEVGAGTALTGYAKNNAIAFSVGARAAVSPASSYSIFGVCGGDAEQVAANQAARAAAIKAAGRYVFDGGVAATHGWRFETPAAHYADAVGVDLLTRTGTLTETQIILPTWPW